MAFFILKNKTTYDQSPEQLHFIKNQHTLVFPNHTLRKALPKPNELANTKHTMPNLIGNYIKIAARNLLRNKAFSALNILGLSIAMSCCLLIVLFLQHELQYDQHYSKGDRIYKVVREIHSQGESRKFYWGTSGLLGSALERDFPEVEKAVRIWHWNVKVERRGLLIPARLSNVDKHIFDVFDIEFIQGSQQTAFDGPSSIIISDRMAHTLYGDEDPMGKVLIAQNSIYGDDYVVRGVFKHRHEPSTIPFNMLVSRDPNAQWRNQWHRWSPVNSFRAIHTYILLQKGVNPETLEQKLPAFMKRYMGEEIQKFNEYHLQPLHRVYLHSRSEYGIQSFGDIDQLYTMCLVAVFILLIACINFMNLATAQSIRRAREVGLRKVVGASRGQLIQQFLGESLIIACLAAGLAIVVAHATLPVFNELIQQNLTFNTNAYVTLFPALIGVVIISGILAGAYPAFVLSGWQPIETLKNQIQSSASGSWFWKGLVMFQFSISIFLIVGTLVVRNQISYMLDRDLGVDTEHLIMLPIFTTSREANAVHANRLSSRYKTVKTAFLSHPNVIKATASQNRAFPTGGGPRIKSVRPEGLPGDDWRIWINEVDEDFIDTMGIEIIAGKNFTPGKGTPTRAWTQEFLINESAAKLFGWENPIGKQMTKMEGGGGAGTVVGVFKDYHFDSLKERIAPLAFIQWARLYAYLTVKIKGGQFVETMAFLEEQWQKFVPNAAFRPIFMDDGLESAYRNELRLRKVAGVSSLLAIMVCCLGLFGLAAISAQRRTKEIGVRKVLGASVGQIVTMFSSEFIKLVAFASLIAWPLAYYMLSDWLADFSYRIGLGVSVFVLSSLLAIAIALITVSYQAWRAAQTNPIDALKYE